MNRKPLAAALACLTLGAAACTQPADRVSGNLSKAADNFEINRRIVFYNGITDTYMLTVEGRCSLGNNDTTGQLTVTCKLGPDQYKKHFLGLSDNVTYFVEQTDAADADEYRYRVIFRPESVLPDPEIN
ncbi:MAG: hypothetical protein R2749_29685 [Acidimicrobiales bacterium]